MNKLIKKMTQTIVITALLAILIPMTAFADSSKQMAKPMTSKVLVNDLHIYFEAYNINDNNYFKLRDIAKAIDGTEKQFEVGWDDENRVISLTSGKGYTSLGGELSRGDGKEKPYILDKSRIYKDGKEIDLRVYNIADNNYFMLRDLGQAFDISITWDDESKTVIIDTSRGYSPEEEVVKTSLSGIEKQVIRLVNMEREEAGLEPFDACSQLSNVARIKSKDMDENHYFDHTSPDFGSPFDMMDSYGVEFNSAGENIAKGHPTAESVVDAWMDSDGHRRNILNSSFGRIGVGVYQANSGINYWTQMFAD